MAFRSIDDNALPATIERPKKIAKIGSPSPSPSPAARSKAAVLDEVHRDSCTKDENSQIQPPTEQSVEYVSSLDLKPLADPEVKIKELRIEEMAETPSSPHDGWVSEEIESFEQLEGSGSLSSPHDGKVDIARVRESSEEDEDITAESDSPEKRTQSLAVDLSRLSPQDFEKIKKKTLNLIARVYPSHDWSLCDYPTTEWKKSFHKYHKMNPPPVPLHTAGTELCPGFFQVVVFGRETRDPIRIKRLGLELQRSEEKQLTSREVSEEFLQHCRRVVNVWFAILFLLFY